MTVDDICPYIMPHLVSNMSILQIGVGNSLVFEYLKQDPLFPDNGSQSPILMVGSIVVTITSLVHITNIDISETVIESMIEMQKQVGQLGCLCYFKITFSENQKHFE